MPALRFRGSGCGYPRLVGIGSGLARLQGYPFDVRYSDGALPQATVAADVAADAYTYFDRLFAGVEPDIALDRGRRSRLVESAAVRAAVLQRRRRADPPRHRGDARRTAESSGLRSVQDLRDASPNGYPKLLATYPDGAGGVDLQPFFDLITLHELGHAFETLGDLRLPTFWLSEIFANLALHAFVATQMPASLPRWRCSRPSEREAQLAARMRAEGYSTLEELEAHYTGRRHPMSPLNYVWFQYRWQRLAAKMFQADGEDGVIRFWDCFHATDRVPAGEPLRRHWPRYSPRGQRDPRTRSPRLALAAGHQADLAPRRTLSQLSPSVASDWRGRDRPDGPGERASNGHPSGLF